MTDPFAQDRADLLETLAFQRGMLLKTVQGITDEQARQRTTTSELTLGGLIKHVAATEEAWARFVQDGPEKFERAGVDFSNWDEAAIATFANRFKLLETEKLEDMVSEYQSVAARTDELVRTVDLNSAQPLPTAPWFPPDTTRTARRVFQHIAVETAQHCGHADIIRESLDGQKSMG